MASFEFNVEKYSVQELKSLFFQAGKNININLYESFYETSIIKCKNKLQQILISQHPNEKMEVLHFLDKASQLLINETYLPNKGQIVLFDRSWYTRALTEPTLGYCSKKQYEEFMTKVNKWEKSLVKKGTELVKFYFSIDKDQQKRRINARKNSKLKYWKLSESDKLMVNKWDVFTLYKNQMFDLTSTDYAPWVVINANNKMIARLSALRYILNNLTYDEKLSLKPPKWGEDLGNYSLHIEGVIFENLTYEQFKILAPFSD